MATPRLLITPGEPAGIGPDILLTLVAKQAPSVSLVAIADPDYLQQRADQLGLRLRLRYADQTSPFDKPSRHGELAVLPLPLGQTVAPGKPSSANAQHLLTALDRAVDLCMSGQADGLVTGPLNKAVVAAGGFDFSGHTEYLAQRCGAAQVVMMLAAPGLRVALATTHLPLSQVPAAIRTDRLRRTLSIIEADLRQHYGLANPCIKVCGLNPHAGEDGLLGREEIEIIQPLISELQAGGMNVHGPYPADTVFTPPHMRDADLILAMYHDQGLPVLKHLGFGCAVNVTLGLPIIRTSVDHGTAFDLAGSGQADHGSLLAAIKEAANMHAASRSTDS